MINETVDLSQVDETPVDQPIVDLSAADPEILPTERVAKRRAEKFSFVNEDPDEEKYKTQIMSGGEQALRSALQAKRSFKAAVTKQAMIADILDKAANSGESVSEQELNTLRLMSVDQLEETSSVLEKAFAEKMADKTAESFLPEETQEALTENFEHAHEVMDAFETIMTEDLQYQKMEEDLEAYYQDKVGWVSTIVNWAETIVPFLSQARLTGSDKLLWGGDALKDLVSNLRSLPKEERIAELESRLEELKESNIFDAFTLIRAMRAYTTGDQSTANLISTLDALDLTGTAATSKLLAKGAAKLGKGAATVAENPLNAAKTAASKVASSAKNTGPKIETLRKSFANILKEVGKKKDVKVSDIAAASGNVDKAVEAKILEEGFTGARFSVEDVAVDSLDDLAWQTNSSFNPLQPEGSNPALVGQRYRRTRDVIRSDEVLNEQNSILWNAAQKTSDVERSADAQRLAMVKAAEEEMLTRYSTLSGKVMDVVEISPQNFGGVGAVRLLIGTMKGNLFKSEKAAVNHATRYYHLPRGSYTVEEVGGKYYLQVERQFNETAEGIRKVPLTTDEETPATLSNVLFGWLRNPDDTVAFRERLNRKAATSLTEELRDLVMQVARTMGPEVLSKQQRRDLSTVLDANRTWISKDPATGKEQMGRFLTNEAAVQRAYNALLKRSATQEEVRAYFTYVQLSDWDYMMRNIGVFRDKSRLGAEVFDIQITAVSPEVRAGINLDANIRNPDGLQHMTFTDVEGIKVDKLPIGEDVNLLLSEPGRKSIVLNLARLSNDEHRMIQKLLPDSSTIQVFAPDQRPFNLAHEDINIHFVMSKDDVVMRPLKFKQYPYKPGGHIAYNDQVFIKVPKIELDGQGQLIYRGDDTFMTVSSRAQAKIVVEKLEEARKMLRDFKNGKRTDLDVIKKFIDENTPMSSDEFLDLYRSKQDLNHPLGYSKSRLDLDTPFFAVRGGNNVGSEVHNLADIIGKGAFRNEVDNVYNPMNFVNKKFAGEKNINIPSLEVGSEQNPIVKYRPSALLDPITTIQDSIAELTRAKNLDNVKISSVERYIREFADVLDWDQQKLYNDPIGAVHNAPIKRNADFKRAAAARNARRALLNLIGTRGVVREAVDGLLMDVFDRTFNTFGQSSVDKLASLDLFRVQDPFRYARAVAFHSKMGLFNPLQFILQAQMVVHSMAIAGPRIGWNGFRGAVLSQYATMTRNPKVIDHFAEIATKHGWKKEEFIESHNAWMDTGLRHMGGSHALYDDMVDQGIFKSKLGAFLNKGTMFFSGGERLVRNTGWHSAYLEWRKANPTKKLGAADRNLIRERADILSGNMTRASNSPVQHGLGSIPTQFLSFQVRLTEQMLGKRLTMMEKARAVFAYSLMYGVPIGTFGTVAGAVWPWYEDIKQEALERGIETNEGFMNIFMHGLPDAALQMITGEQVNYSQRYGFTGNPIFKELWTGEKGVFEMLGGASASILGDIIGNLHPVGKGMLDIMSGTPGGVSVLMSDITDAASEISSFNNVAKAFFALNSGLYVTRNEVVVDEVNNMQALLLTLGLTPRDVSDAFIKMESLKEMANIRKDFQKQYNKAMIKASNETDPEIQRVWMKRAAIFAQAARLDPFTENEWIRGALNQNGFLVDNIDWAFHVSKAPEDQAEARKQILMDKDKERLQ